LKKLWIVVLMTVLAFFSGCPKSNPQSGNAALREECVYSPLRAHIVGLTSVKSDPAGGSKAIISAYVSLHDRFDSNMKAPGVFRFELYEYVMNSRSSEKRGKRLYVWPDLDLNDAVANNSYWKDYLRAYNFVLDPKIDLSVPKPYILQVTFLTPGKRLGDLFPLKGGNR